MIQTCGSTHDRPEALGAQNNHICSFTCTSQARTKMPKGTRQFCGNIAHSNDAMQSPVQDVQNLFLRLLSAAPVHISQWVLHKNSGLLPVQADIYKASARLWNAMRVDPLLSKALESDVCVFLILGCMPMLHMFTRALVHQL